MRFLQFSVASVALLAICSAYACPNDGSRSFHADVDTGCQVYHLCENSQMRTLSCPSGKAFDHQSKECKDKSLVQCIETSPIHFHKRSVEEVHSVSVEHLKSSTKEILKALKNLSKAALQETLPTVYNRIENEFVPVIESFKRELEPFFYQQALPQLVKLYSYSKRMEERIVKKVYRSYELSNSTHLNVVSFDDVIDQISADLKPFLRLAKYFSMKLMRSSRTKREVGVSVTDYNQHSNIEVHSISKEHLKSSLKGLIETVKILAENNVQEIFPSVYQRIFKDYFPLFQSIKNEIDYKYNKDLHSTLLNINAYAKRMGDKILKKVYQSYELSNSTHLNIVSFDDVLEEFLNDIQPHVSLEKFISARLLKSFRNRRDVTQNQPSSSTEVHSISIKHIKESTKELINEIKSLSKNALKDILPALYDITLIKSFKADFEPIFKKLVLPQLNQYQSYAKSMGDKIIRKIYQSYELSNATHLNVVSFDDIMDEVLTRVKQLDVSKYFSSKQIRNFRIKREASSILLEHREKRSAEKIHSLPIATLKDSSKELLNAIKSLSKSTLKEMLPSVYNHIEKNYVPIVKSYKNELELIFKRYALPNFHKIHAYAKRMGDKIFRKVFRTYELSNSTHLNVVSFDDVMDEIFYDIKPILERYFSIEQLRNSRNKRDVGVPVSDVPELFLGQMEPVLKNMFLSLTGMFSQDQNTLTSRVIIPTLMEMMNDPETKADVKKIFWSSKAAFSPLMYEIMNRQSYYNPDGTIIRIPRHQINQAKAFFYRETKPIISKIAEKHLPQLLMRCSENTDLIFSTIDRVKSLPSRKSFKDDLVRFYQKHYSVLKTSSSTHISSYTLSEIKQDLKPIEVGFLQMALDYVDQLENSWLKIFFGRDSFVYRAIFGERETFAVPSGSFYSSPTSSNTRGRASQAVPRRSYQNASRSAANRGSFSPFGGRYGK